MKPHKQTFSPRPNVLNLLSISLNILKHLNQHLGIKPTYISKPILLLESLHIKSQGQMLPNPVQVMVQQTTLTLNVTMFVEHGENNA